MRTLGAMKKLRIPPLAVGIGIYLPMAVILPVVIGSVLGHLYNRWALTTGNPEADRDQALFDRLGLHGKSAQ